jgi:uncharacterized membrane protein
MSRCVQIFWLVVYVSGCVFSFLCPVTNYFTTSLPHPFHITTTKYVAHIGETMYIANTSLAVECYTKHYIERKITS